MTIDAALDFAGAMRGRRFGTILADPPWRFQNRTGKMLRSIGACRAMTRWSWTRS